MEVINRVLPNGEQMAGFLKDPEEGPIYMVNLLKFKAQAEYADGRATSLTGQEAYGLYAEGVQKLLEAVGGSVTFAGEVSRLTLGEVEELWDEVAIACYPTRGAMLQNDAAARDGGDCCPSRRGACGATQYRVPCESVLRG